MGYSLLDYPGQNWRALAELLTSYHFRDDEVEVWKGFTELLPACSQKIAKNQRMAEDTYICARRALRRMFSQPPQPTIKITNRMRCSKGLFSRFLISVASYEARFRLGAEGAGRKPDDNSGPEVIDTLCGQLLYHLDVWGANLPRERAEYERSLGAFRYAAASPTVSATEKAAIAGRYFKALDRIGVEFSKFIIFFVSTALKANIYYLYLIYGDNVREAARALLDLRRQRFISYEPVLLEDA